MRGHNQVGHDRSRSRSPDTWLHDHGLDRRVKMRQAVCVVDESRLHARRVIQARRGELRLSQQGLAASADVSLRTIGRLESGHRVSTTKESRIERALGWKRGGIDAAFNNREPELLEPDETYDLVRIAVNALVDLEIRKADATTYNRELARWEHILGDDANITTVRKEAHRIAVERLANPQGNSSAPPN